MADSTDLPPDEALRRQAEARLAEGRTPRPLAGGEAGLHRLIHELQVHQIELELQNAELATARHEIETGLARYTELYDFAPIGYFTLDPMGEIRQVNLAGAGLLGLERSKVVGRRLGAFVAQDSLADYNAGLARAFRDRTKVAWEAEIRTAAGPLVAHIEAVVEDDGQSCLAMVMDITERRRAENRAAEAGQRLHELAGHLEALREEQAAALAREVHDELGGILTMLKLGLHTLARQAAEPQRVAERAAALGKLTQSAIDTIRRIAASLRPTTLDDGGLAAAIATHAREFSRLTGIEVTTRLPEALPLDDQRAIAVFRVAQEALTNAARHSGASRIDIALMQDGGGLRLELRDNGCGLVPGAEAKAETHGLLGMRERALFLGGRLDIETAPGRGTAVILTVPLGS